MLQVIEARVITPFMIVDGFAWSELPPFLSFNVFVSSGAFNHSAMGPNMLLLPSWSRTDAIDFGTESASTLTIGEIRQKHWTFGGDLRSIFQFTENEALRDLHDTLRTVDESRIKLLLSSSGSSHADQVDRIRRFRVQDPNDPDHYVNPKYWTAQVESMYIHRIFLRFASMNWLDGLFRFARGSSLYGHTFELVAHAVAAQQKEMQLTNVLLRSTHKDPPSSRPTKRRAGNPSALVVEPTEAMLMSNPLQPSVDWPEISKCVGDITVDCSNAIFRGDTLKNALEAMREVVTQKASYWAPQYPTFPAIDAVAKCTLSGCHESAGKTREVIGLLQYTVAERKEVNMKTINAIVKALTPGSTKDVWAHKLDKIVVEISPRPKVDGVPDQPNVSKASESDSVDCTAGQMEVEEETKQSDVSFGLDSSRSSLDEGNMRTSSGAEEEDIPGTLRNEATMSPLYAASSEASKNVQPILVLPIVLIYITPSDSKLALSTPEPPSEMTIFSTFFDAPKHLQKDKLDQVDEVTKIATSGVRCKRAAV